MKRLTVVLAGGAVGILLAGCGSNGNSDAPEEDAKIVRKSASWVIDPNDQVSLTAWADEIFVGTVIKKTATDNSDPKLPRTEYQVGIETVVEGTPPSRVTVVQEAGYTEDGSELILFRGDSLLESNTTYLFAARVDENGDRNIFPIVGNEELETSSEESEVVSEYAEAAEAAEDLPESEMPPT